MTHFKLLANIDIFVKKNLQIELTGTRFFISWDLIVHVFLNEMPFLLYHYTFDIKLNYYAVVFIFGK